MGLKEWLFGKDKKTSSKTEAEAVQTLKKQLNSLELESKNLFRKSEEQKVVAKSMLKSGNKSGAKQALTRSTLFLQRYNQIQNMSLNLSTQVEAITTAKFTADTVKALGKGSVIVEETLAQVSPLDVERTMVQMEDQRDRISMMTESLADVTSLEMELDSEMMDSIDDQLASLEMEINETSHGDLPIAGAGVSAEAETSTATEEKTDKSNIDSELDAIEKELEGKS
ncbi:MAG: Snf7 family protein [Candidatus Heimdallarchaeota archaeon]|nr:Snf7 family protein [Candidatus Heimdallarchaeota archaeon]